MATISNTPRPGYVWDSTDNVWYPIGTGPHTHADYITSGSAINPNIVDAKGDIIAATAADTVARLAVGSNDQVLTADSSTATGLKWATPAAGGITLLSTTSLSGTSTTVSNISQAYQDLVIRVDAPKVATSGDELFLRINSVSTTSYAYCSVRTSGSTNGQESGISSWKVANIFTDTATNTAWVQFYIPDYANTSTKKSTTYISQNDSTSSNLTIGNINSSGAVTSITVGNILSSTFNGGTIKIYGVK
jgi:hypothetical protein